MNKCSSRTINSKVAYLIKDLDDEPKSGQKITISQYFNDTEIINKIKSEELYLVCKNGHKLYACKYRIISDHFKHSNSNNLSPNPMSEWHKEWSKEFENNEVVFPKILGCFSERRADAYINEQVIEFQNSFITKDEVDGRYNDYTVCHNKNIMWIINCNQSIDIIEVNTYNTYIIKFVNSYWKYQHFTTHNEIYLNYEDKIFKINPNDVKSRMVNINEYHTVSTFINSIKNGIDIWKNEKPIQCRLYYKQMGAGSGKTYNSIQILNGDKRFDHKNTIIYLTKMNAARNVINNELMEQYQTGKLNNINDLQPLNVCDSKKYAYKYRFKTINKKEIIEKDRIIIMGTIDSFMYAIGKRTNKTSDYFYDITKSVADGDNNFEKAIKYAGLYTRISNECLIVIDETQDLPEIYIEALATIMRTTYVDILVIGDKLQSILYDKNAYTLIEQNGLPDVEIIKMDGINQIRRFQNEELMSFVNKMINFKDYNLPEIDSIASYDTKKYQKSKAVNVFGMAGCGIKGNSEKDKEFIKYIIKAVDNEIDKHQYTPENFMFIFPILKNNYFANALQENLQDYWILKFDDEDYRNNVLYSHPYWSERLKLDSYDDFVMLHTCERGSVINLDESKYASRILSIHSSKGTGREVVFVLNISEKTLMRFNKSKENILIYESLLHVALTRQKRSLYLGITSCDDIYNRMHNTYKSTVNIEDLYVDISNINCNILYRKLILNNETTSEHDKIIESHISGKNYESKIPSNNNNNKIVDMGHHFIRYCVMYYYVILNFQKEKDSYKGIKGAFSDIIKYPTKYYKSDEYYKTLTKQYHNRMDKYTQKEIPILYFSSEHRLCYYKYKEILENIIEHIKYKLKSCLVISQLPKLCPLEAVILLHLIEINQNYQYAEITIMNVYNILDSFYKSSNYLDEKHTSYSKCKCVELLKNNNNEKNNIICNAIVEHYDTVKNIRNIHKKFIKKINKKYGSIDQVYINKPVSYQNNGNSSLSIFDKIKIFCENDKYIFNIILKPQFNELNFNETIYNGIMTNYLIKKRKIKTKNDMDSDKQKKIITCIITLDTDKPIIYDFKLDDMELYGCIYKMLFNYFQSCHIIIHNKYKSYIKKENKSKLKQMNQMLNNYEGAKIPKYIKDFFYDIDEKYQKCNTKDDKIKIAKLLNNYNLFNSELNEYLIKDINKLFGNIDNDGLNTLEDDDIDI